MLSGPSTCRRAALLLVLGGLMPAFAETAPPPSFPRWQDFRSEEGRFRVELPGAPRVERNVHRTAMGSVTEVGFRVAWGDAEVAVVCARTMRTRLRRSLSPSAGLQRNAANG